MRIIRPLDDMAAVTTSDAPDDDVAVWEAQGRDLLSTLSKPIFDIAGGNLYAVDEMGGDIYKQNLSTGVTSKITGIISTVKYKDFRVSPNESYFYVSYSVDGTIYVRVIEFSSMSVKWSDQYDIPWSSMYSFESLGSDSAVWAGDSSKITVGLGKEVVDVLVGTWVATTIFSSSFVGYNNYLISSMVIAAGWVYLAGQDSGFDVSGRIDLFFIGFPVGGSPSAHNKVYSASPSPVYLRDNPVISEIRIIARNNISSWAYGTDTINQTIFSTNIYIDRPQAIKITDTHLITRSLSTSPVWNFYNLSDYSLDTSLTIPALPDRGEGIAIGTNYTVVQQNQGIVLVDNTTRELVAQQNPNVIKGDTYIYNDKVYEVLTNNNDQPDEGAAKDPSPTWLDLGAINRLRMFDNKINSVTRGNGSLNITIDAKQALNGIALFNVTAATVQITMTDGTYGLVYDTGEVTMRDTSQIRGWSDWFFSLRPKMRDLARIDLPTFPNAIVEVTLTGDSVSLGEIVIGRVQKIGETQYGGTSVGIIDSSIKERDDFGNFVIAERPFSKRVEFDVHVPTSGISGVQNILAGYRAKPVVYVGAEGEEALVVFGFYRDFQINYTSYSIAASTITVEGL